MYGDLSNNNIEHLTNLYRLDLPGNDFNGTVDWHQFKDLSNLEILYLYSNELTGTIDFTGLPSSLTILSLYNNKFSGNIENFSHLRDLTDFYVYTNELDGTIDWSEFKSFNKSISIDFYFYDNQLTGNIDLSDINFDLLGSTTNFHGYNNQFNGTINLGAMTSNMQQLYLNNNPNIKGGVDFSTISNDSSSLTTYPRIWLDEYIYCVYCPDLVPECLMYTNTFANRSNPSTGYCGGKIGCETTCVCDSYPCPTTYPTSIPSLIPSIMPSNDPSTIPTSIPSATPSSEPTSKPTVTPTELPSQMPTSMTPTGTIVDDVSTTESGVSQKNTNGEDSWLMENIMFIIVSCVSLLVVIICVALLLVYSKRKNKDQLKMQHDMLAAKSGSAVGSLGSIDTDHVDSDLSPVARPETVAINDLNDDQTGQIPMNGGTRSGPLGEMARKSRNEGELHLRDLIDDNGSNNDDSHEDMYDVPANGSGDNDAKDADDDDDAADRETSLEMMYHDAGVESTNQGLETAGNTSDLVGIDGENRDDVIAIRGNFDQTKSRNVNINVTKGARGRTKKGGATKGAKHERTKGKPIANKRFSQRL